MSSSVLWTLSDSRISKMAGNSQFYVYYHLISNAIFLSVLFFFFTSRPLCLCYKTQICCCKQAMSGKEKEFEAALRILRGPQADISEEADLIKVNLHADIHLFLYLFSMTSSFSIYFRNLLNYCRKWF